MFNEEGIFPIGDGLLDVDAERLKGLLVSHDINEIYEVEQTPFARGKFAAVRRAIHKNSGLHFAAKFLKRRRRAQSSDKEIKHEIAVLMLCEGEENIVNLNAVHETRSDTALLLELATGGELQTILDNEECLSEAHARHCMREVLKALKFLHDRSIAHLDLKPQNILLAGKRIEDGLKLCDFGISRVVCEGINVREMAGTPDYVAPEVLQYEPLSLLTDIWSVGVLAYVLLSGFSPFGGDTKQETFLNISQCALTFPDNLFGGVSQAAIDFIRRALRIKPNDRMNAAGCLEHNWLKDECSLDRQIYMHTQAEADYVDEPDEQQNVDEDDEPEEQQDNDVANVEHEQSNNRSSGSNTAATTMQSNGDANTKVTHNGHRSHNSVSKIPIAAIKYSSNSNGYANCSGSTKSSPTTETTTAIHTLPGLATATATTTTGTAKPTQIVTPTRRASDFDKENTYTATFVKKPTKLCGGTAAAAAAAAAATNSSSTIILLEGEAVRTASVNSNATLCLFPDAPTTPKVIRKAPATSVKALVKKFQLENSGDDSEQPPQQQQHQQQQQQQQQQLSFAPTSNIRKCSVSNAASMRRSCSHSTSNGGGSSGSTSSSNSSLASNCGPAGSSNGFSHCARRASEPLTSVHKKQTSGNSTSIFGSNHNGGNISAVGGGASTPGAGSSASSNGTGGSATLLLNGRLPAHHLHHHHMHHHHHVVLAAKNAAATATNNLSLDQGIIC